MSLSSLLFFIPRKKQSVSIRKQQAAMDNDGSRPRAACFFFSDQRLSQSQFFEQHPHKLTRNASALLPFTVWIQFIRRKRLPDAECAIVNHRQNRGGLIPLLPHLPAMHQTELPRGVILRRKPQNSGYFIAEVKTESISFCRRASISGDSAIASRRSSA